MVYLCFPELGYGEVGASTLTSLTTFRNVAPTGAPTSPMLGNIVLSRADEELAAFANKTGLTYTRYADDLTFSSQEHIEENVLPEIHNVIAQYGFNLKKKKTRFMGRGDRMEATGVVINHTPICHVIGVTLREDTCIVFFGTLTNTFLLATKWRAFMGY